MVKNLLFGKLSLLFCRVFFDRQRTVVVFDDFTTYFSPEHHAQQNTSQHAADVCHPSDSATLSAPTEGSFQLQIENLAADPHQCKNRCRNRYKENFEAKRQHPIADCTSAIKHEERAHHSRDRSTCTDRRNVTGDVHESLSERGNKAAQHIKEGEF